MLLVNFFVVAVLGGTFGGLLNALNKKSGLQLPHIQESTNLGKVFKPGFIRNILLGVGASIVFIGLVTFIPYSYTLLQILSLRIIAGFSGSKLLAKASEKVADQARELLEFLNKKKE